MKVLNVKVCEMAGRKIVLYHFTSVVSYRLLAAFLTVLKIAMWDAREGHSSTFSSMTSIQAALGELERFSSGNTASVHRELESAAKVLQDTAKEEDLNGL